MTACRRCLAGKGIPVPKPTLISPSPGLSAAASVTGIGEPEEIRTLIVTHGILPAVGVRPALGRWFSEADDAAAVSGVVVAGDEVGVVGDSGVRRWTTSNSRCRMAAPKRCP